MIKPQIMTKEDIINRLKSIVKPYVRDQEAFDNLTENTDFITDLKINSANLVDIILDLEEAFDISIDNLSMEKMINVKSALEIVETKLAEK
jgi:acyl carrier protein